MKVAILSESPADDDVHRVFVDALVGEPTEPIGLRLRERPGGWPSVLKLLPKAALTLYYETDADALVVVVDSNHSPIHDESHEHKVEGAGGPQCRLCKLRKELRTKFRPKKPLAHRARLNFAIGLAVPAIEAWFRCGTPRSEALWRTGTQSGKYPYDKRQLKIDAYGTDHPVSALARDKGVEHAKRAVERLHELEARFPGGFGALARSIRSWRAAE